MGEDVTEHNLDDELPAPDDSSFFADESEDGAEPEPAGAEPEPAGAEPEPAGAEPGAEPTADTEPADMEGSSEGESIAETPDLGATQPHVPLAEDQVDGQAAQPTQLLEPVAASQADAEAMQMTQAMPAVTPPEASATSPGEAPMVVAGSRVIIVVSRGTPETPSAAPVATPHVLGLSQGEALSQLQQAELSAQVFNEYSDAPRGQVVGQLPPYGQSVAVGSEAVLLVSSGPAPADALSVPLPDVVGLSEADALAKLQEAGLSPQVVRDFNSAVVLGVVAAQLPNGRPPGKGPKKKRSLWWLWLMLVLAVLFAASGGVYYYLNRTASVPNLVGLSQAQAEQAISAAGFKLGSVTTTQTLTASEVGKVTSQTPPPTTQLRLIDPVNITISGGQKLFAVPNMLGKTQALAQSALATAGLKAAIDQAYSQTVPRGSIITQSPPPGEKVPYQTTIGLTVSLGVQNVTVPGVQALSRGDAANRLKAANLSSQAVIEYTYTGTTKGQVFAQYPTAGMQISPGTIVGLLVSNGPPPSSDPSSTPTSSDLATVPSVVGQSTKDAQSTLKKAHLGNTIVNWGGTNRPAGEVVGQAPEVGTTVPRNVAVIIFVSNGK